MSGRRNSAVEYIKKHAKDGKPFFVSVNFMGMHQPTSPNKAFQGKSRLGNYSDKMMEMDYNIGRRVEHRLLRDHRKSVCDAANKCVVTTPLDIGIYRAKLY